MGEKSDFLEIMPAKFKDPLGDPVESYRNYYKSFSKDKPKYLKWTKRPKPDWFDDTKNII